MLLGVPLGIFAAVRKQSALDRGVVGISVVGISVPAFATGILLLYIFAVALGWFPVFGQGSGRRRTGPSPDAPSSRTRADGHGLILKLTRTAMIGALETDYVTFARARGIPERRVLTAYALRNALIPIVTAGGLSSPTCRRNRARRGDVRSTRDGLAPRYFVRTLDLPMVQALVILIAVIVVVVNLVADLIYLLIDPRISFTKVDL